MTSPDWSSVENVKKYFKALCLEWDMKPSELYPILRYMLTGKTSGLDLMSGIHLLGYEECNRRIVSFIQHLNNECSKNERDQTGH
jgi:glutamyl/glutaminyl-tRNA synthetase